MPIPVIILEPAESDLRELKRYLSKEFGLSSWQNSYTEIKKAIDNIAQFPSSGMIPQELASIGQMQYRQVISGMNRIIYEIKSSMQKEEKIYIHVITDVRQDLQSLLTRRLFQSLAN